MKHWKRILVRVLVAAQLLSAAPLASAMPVAQRADALPCAEMMGMESMPSAADGCPCCPDGAHSVAACLAACVAAAGITSSFIVSVTHAGTSRARLPIVAVHSRAFDPPLKPPPIA